MSDPTSLVLLVRADAQSAAVTSEMLGSLGLRCLHCATATEALQWLSMPRKVDLLLVDLHLPDIDGIHLLPMLSRMPGAVGVPVVGISSRYANDAGARALLSTHGVLGFLESPLRLTALRDAVGAAVPGLSASPQGASPVVEPSPQRPPELRVQHEAWDKAAVVGHEVEVEDLHADLVLGTLWLPVRLLRVSQVIVELELITSRPPPVGTSVELSVMFRGTVGGAPRRFLVSAGGPLRWVERHGEGWLVVLEVDHCFPRDNFQLLFGALDGR